jgi:hypothetical protein
VGRKRREVATKAEAGGVESLRELFAGKIDLSLLGRPGNGHRQRVYDRGTTFLLFLLQVMGSLSCEAMVKYLQATHAVKGKDGISSRNSGYCQARGRLDLSLLRRISDHLIAFLGRAMPSERAWRGFRILAVDGTEADLADTPANRKAYPKGGRRKPGKPEPDRGGLLPKLNLVAVFDLFTGGAAAWEHGPERVGEQTLWRRLIGRTVTAGVLVLGDALYCTFGNFVEVLANGGHAAFVAKDRRIYRGRGRSARDFLIRLPKPKVRAKGWTKAQWARLPDFVELRVATLVRRRPGFLPETIRIVTTLLDKATYPAVEIIGLHARRWEAELRFRDLKSAMGMETLRCKTPDMLEKELMMHMIALNLVRALSIDAARLRGVDPARISFSAALVQTGEWMRLAVAGCIPAKRRKQLRIMFMKALADAVVRQRPGRSEPRAVKKRPKSYPPLKTARRNHHAHFNPKAA